MMLNVLSQSDIVEKTVFVYWLHTSTYVHTYMYFLYIGISSMHDQMKYSVFCSVHCYIVLHGGQNLFWKNS